MNTSFKALTAGVLAEYGVNAINLHANADAASESDILLHATSDYRIADDSYLGGFSSYESPIDYSAGYAPAYDPYPINDSYYGEDLTYAAFEPYHGAHPIDDGYYNDEGYIYEEFDPYVSGYYGSFDVYDQYANPYYYDDYGKQGSYGGYDPYNDYHDYNGYGFDDYNGSGIHLLHGDGGYGYDYGEYVPEYDQDLHFPIYATGAYGVLESDSEDDDHLLPIEALSYHHYGDPIPHSFNYGTYLRFNTWPEESEDTSGDTVPIYSDSSHGHFSRDSHRSYTTSDADGRWTDSDLSNELSISSQEPHLDELGYSDAEDDSYNGYGPYVQNDKVHRIINGRVDNFEYKSNTDTDDDDGFTDSLYRFSNSTSDRGEITDPDTDSALDLSRDVIEEYKANFPLF